MNMFKKQYLDVPTFLLEKVLVTPAVIIDWVSEMKRILPEGSQTFSKTSRRLARNLSPLPWMSTKINYTMQDRDKHYRKAIKSNSHFQSIEGLETYWTVK